MDIFAFIKKNIKVISIAAISIVCIAVVLVIVLKNDGDINIDDMIKIESLTPSDGQESNNVNDDDITMNEINNIDDVNNELEIILDDDFVYTNSDESEENAIQLNNSNSSEGQDSSGINGESNETVIVNDLTNNYDSSNLDTAAGQNTNNNSNVNDNKTGTRNNGNESNSNVNSNTNTDGRDDIVVENNYADKEENLSTYDASGGKSYETPRIAVD